MSSSSRVVTCAKSTNVRMGDPLKAIGWALRTLDRIAPSLAASLAASLFLRPRRVPRPASEEEWTAGARSRRVCIGTLSVLVRSWGHGPAVLLAHGWEGRGTQLGAIGEALVKRRYEVIAPDFPAHGDSPGRKTTLLEFATVIRELAAAHNPIGIVAHSFGAAATNVALRDTPFPGRLVYISPPEDFRYFTLVFASMLGISEDLALRMEREIERRFDVRWSELRGTALARQMDVPLLVIHDEQDHDVPVRYGQALAAAWPGAELHITQGLGHRRILRDEPVIEATINFLESSPGN